LKENTETEYDVSSINKAGDGRSHNTVIGERENRNYSSLRIITASTFEKLASNSAAEVDFAFN